MLNNNSESIDKNSWEDAKTASSPVLRKCCACGKIADRNGFIRILQEHGSGNIIINPNSKQFGRSTYLCKSHECLKLAKKKKRLKGLSEEQFLELEMYI